MNSEQAKAAAETDGRQCGKASSRRRAEVLAAVKDDNRDYKPDAKSRTAWELATHLATADIWFIDSILERQVRVGPRGRQEGGVAVQERQRHRRVLQEDVPGEAEGAARDCRRDKLHIEPRLLRRHQDGRRSQCIGFANNHSVHHRGSSPRICARWDRRCRTSTAAERRRTDEVPTTARAVVSRSPRLHRSASAATTTSSRSTRRSIRHLEAAEIHRRVIAAGGPALLFTNVTGSRLPARHESVRHGAPRRAGVRRAAAAPDPPPRASWPRRSCRRRRQAVGRARRRLASC